MLYFLCAVLLIATAWDIPYVPKGGHFGIKVTLAYLYFKLRYMFSVWKTWPQKVWLQSLQKQKNVLGVPCLYHFL